MRLSLWVGIWGEVLVIYSFPRELECMLDVKGEMSFRVKQNIEKKAKEENSSRRINRIPFLFL